MRSVFAPVMLPLAALIAALVRWWTQGSGNLYTALSKRFYVPDPDLGWRESVFHPVWLGLEVCAVIAAIAVGLAVGGLVIRKLEARRSRRMTALRALAWVVAAAPLIVPIAAFASGPGVSGGRDTLPAERAVAVETGLEGALDAPAGRYEVVPHAGTVISAQLSAGGETFDARFVGGIRGIWRGDPRALTTPMTAEVSADAASVDTGIGERSKHARESYLAADKHPQITFTLGQIIASRADGPGRLAFRAKGTVGLIGRVHPVEITGVLAVPDAAARARLGLTGAHLVVQADFALLIKDTALAPDAGDFDGDRIPIHVSLVLRHAGA